MWRIFGRGITGGMYTSGEMFGSCPLFLSPQENKLFPVSFYYSTLNSQALDLWFPNPLCQSFNFCFQIGSEGLISSLNSCH